MNDPLLVRGFQRFRDLLRDRERLVDRSRTACDALRKIVALDQLHHQGGEVRGLFESVNRGDVRMVEGREHFGFALEARQAIRITRHRGGQHLDRNLAFQIRVGGLIHLAHTTDAYLRGDLVDADSDTGS